MITASRLPVKAVAILTATNLTKFLGVELIRGRYGRGAEK